jgi:hypothetical protein
MHSIAQTLMPLAQWVEIMQLDSWYFAQFDNVPHRAYVRNALVSGCDSFVVYESAWRDLNRLNRESVAFAIRQAESMWANYANFWPAPKWITNEGQVLRRRKFIKKDGPNFCFQPRYGKVQCLGTRTRTLIEEEATVTLLNTIADSNNVDEDFSVVVDVSDVAWDGLTAEEIAVYFHETDRFGKNIDEWQIRPLTVVVEGAGEVGGTITITGDSFLLARPDLYLPTNPDVIDAQSALSYVGRVSVYRIQADATNIGSVWYDDNCSVGIDIDACIIDSETGYVCGNPSDTETTCGTPADKSPTSIKYNYLAGCALVDGKMDIDCALPIARLAAALLDCDACGCACHDNEGILSFWRDIPALESKSGIPVRLAGNTHTMEELYPFGKSRAGIFAWQQAKQLRIWQPAII